MSAPVAVLAGLVAAVLVLLGAVLVTGWVTDRRQRADARPEGRHVALPARVAVVPRASTAGDPPWPVQPILPPLPAPAERLADRYQRLVTASPPPPEGFIPPDAACALKHHGLRAQAVDAAMDSIFSKDMARQVREATDA